MIFFNLHTHSYTNQDDVIEIVNQYPQEFDESIPNYSIGIHPWYIVEDSINNDLQIIESKLQYQNCIAIGECGLDKRIEVSIALQQMVFEKQLVLAQKYQKPVIIHCVGAFQEVIAIKKKMNITVPMIIHGFSKNFDLANQLIKNGFYLSFGKSLFQISEMELVFKSLPNNRLFLETDTIEKDIKAVYKIASKYKNIKLEEIEAIITFNFNSIFNRNK
ncbi:MAG: TatD family deoxyribonuclease [Flavobacteriaceae bacterium]|nr:TatD family deoxyribonuclease [Flavobacteriaceae bacterium]